MDVKFYDFFYRIMNLMLKLKVGMIYEKFIINIDIDFNDEDWLIFRL